MRIENNTKKCYDYILEKMLSGSFRQGDYFHRVDIASHLKMSRTPVSDAINKLVAEGFLETNCKMGTRVRIMELSDLQGILLVRLALECQAARIYSGDTLKKARGNLQLSAELIDSLPSRSKERFEEEKKFHESLVRLSDCKFLINAFQKSMLMYGVFQTSLLYHLKNPLDSKCSNSHSDLLDWLEHPDPEKAETAIRKHLYIPMNLILGSRIKY